ncbi:MAG: hypothetical protein R3B93_10740 [Bacteroidia bacterium]
MAEIGWAVSPAAIKEVIEGTIEDKYIVPFKLPVNQRIQILEPLFNQIKKPTFPMIQHQVLKFYLKKFYGEEKKVLIFTERQSTVEYLEKARVTSAPT